MNKGTGPEGSARRLKDTLRGLLPCTRTCQPPASGSTTCSATASQMSLKHFVHSAKGTSTDGVLQHTADKVYMTTDAIMLKPNTTCW